MDQVVGVIGLGAMGLPIAIRLARAGFRLVVLDLSPAAVEQVLAEGAVQGAASPREVALASDVLITCLPSPQAVEAVYAEVEKRGLLACDCSTVGPASRSGCTTSWRRAACAMSSARCWAAPPRRRAASCSWSSRATRRRSPSSARSTR